MLGAEAVAQVLLFPRGVAAAPLPEMEAATAVAVGDPMLPTAVVAVVERVGILATVEAAVLAVLALAVAAVTALLEAAERLAAAVAAQSSISMFGVVLAEGLESSAKAAAALLVPLVLEAREAEMVLEGLLTELTETAVYMAEAALHKEVAVRALALV